MRVAEVLRRIEAWKAGEPLPVGKALPWPRIQREDALVVAFVRMAGESIPWGIAVGHPGDEPTILTIPEPRQPDRVADLMSRFALRLLDHLPHPRAPWWCARREAILASAGSDAEAVIGKELDALARRRQLWLPGPTHLEMLHFLAFRFQKPTHADPEVAKRIGAAGRAAGWLFRESTRPGQMRVMDATRRLRDVFAFPAEDTRQAHLGYLLAWLTTGSTREERLAAAAVAERDSVGVTMAPDLERKQLAPLVDRWSTLKEDDVEGATRVDREIEDVLRPELLRRFQLTVAAFDLLEADPRGPNTQLEKIAELGAREFEYQCWKPEGGALPAAPTGEEPRRYDTHPETDFHPPAAAGRYFAHVHASELSVAELLHGDPALIDAAVEVGNAFRGRIVDVVDEGAKRTRLPVWTIECPAEGVLRLREESDVCVAGQRGRTGKIRTITIEGGVRRFVVDIVGWKLARSDDAIPAATDAVALEGTMVSFVGTGPVGISFSKSLKVWDASGPGAWLTHAAPPPAPTEPVEPDTDLLALVERIGGR